jgi:predicted O-methyltransferase YrrM
MSEYNFTSDWFSNNIHVWDKILVPLQPKEILEIGSYEGRSACYMIENFTEKQVVKIMCVDTWEGSADIDKTEMGGVENRFDSNVGIALKKATVQPLFEKVKGNSQEILPILITRENRFDLIYIDGSHQAPDVLTDAIMAFQLLRVGGLMVFDDYLLQMEEVGYQNPLNMPKPAIDAFLNIFQRKMVIFRGAPIYQLICKKNSA